MVITKKHYVAPIKPEAIHMQWLTLTVSPRWVSLTWGEPGLVVFTHAKN